MNKRSNSTAYYIKGKLLLHLGSFIIFRPSEKVMKLVENLRKQEKVCSFFFSSIFSGRGESRDFICIFGVSQLDKNKQYMCLTSFQPATANVSKDLDLGTDPLINL